MHTDTNTNLHTDTDRQTARDGQQARLVLPPVITQSEMDSVRRVLADRAARAHEAAEIFQVQLWPCPSLTIHPNFEYTIYTYRAGSVRDNKTIRLSIYA